jgi:3-deoxy-D-manno-octulosonate 8-phosphate phosphatase (KDO 8-P phosphatase)
MAKAEQANPLDDATFAKRAKGLAWLLLDVDGVLTDGALIYGPKGEQLKSFDVRDGLGIKLAQGAGLKVGILSGRASAALVARSRELGLDAFVQNRSDKREAFAEFLAAHETTADRVAVIGDDLPDLPLFARAALSFAPADAAPEVRARAHRVLSRPGGRGAVREMIEMILRARGAWDGIVARFVEAGR